MSRNVLSFSLLLVFVASAVFGSESEPAEDPINPEEAAVTIGSSSGTFSGKLNEVNRARSRGDYPGALTLARASALEAEQARDTAAQAAFLFVLGRTYWSVGDLPASIETLQQTLRLAEPLADPDLLSSIYNALGLSYTEAREFDAAARHFSEALRIAESWGDRSRIAYVLNGTANNLLARRDYSAARTLHLRALALREAIEDRIGAADSITNLGTIDLATGDPSAALDDFRRALATYQSINQPRRVANGHRRIASALRRLGRLDEAMAELHTALDIAEPLNSPAVLAGIHRELSRTHEARGELRSALLYQRNYAADSEALLSEQSRLRVVELDARYQSERRETEIQLLRLDQEAKAAELARRRQQNALLGGGLTLVLGLGTVVYFAQRARLRAERSARAADERARAEAEQAARLKSRLLQIAAHDLKAPLSAVSASALRIEQRPSETSSVVELARHIRTDAAHMGGLVREFLDSAAIEAGRIQLQRGPVNLLAAARDAVDDYRPLAESKRQRITLVPAADPDALPHVLADSARMRQILDNLIANALKFTPSGGSVEVGVGMTGRFVFAEVRDSGPGLKPEDLSKMFQPFQPLSATPTGREASHGLGLFITRELVSMHDGLLEIESQPDQGATFRILLPAVA
jgi:signal transduction histidine kinase